VKSKLVGKKTERLYDDKDEFFKDLDEELSGDWRTAKTGEWIVADDGQVCRILHRGTFSDGREYVRTILGTYPVRENVLIQGEIAEDVHRFSKSNKNRKYRIEDKNPNGREIVFAKYVANGMPPDQAYLRIFKTNDSVYSKNASSALLKTKRVKKLISEETKKMMGKVGIDEEYLLYNTKYVIDDEDGRASDKLRAIEMLMKVSGMFPNDKKTESLTVFQGFSKEQLQSLNSGRVKALGHAKKDIT